MFGTLDLLACATCRVDPNSAAAEAATGAIWLMLGVMGVLFTFMAGVVVKVVRRSRQFPVPGDFPN